jgi:hypothetical protein
MELNLKERINLLIAKISAALKVRTALSLGITAVITIMLNYIVNNDFASCTNTMHYVFWPLVIAYAILLAIEECSELVQYIMEEVKKRKDC